MEIENLLPDLGKNNFFMSLHYASIDSDDKIKKIIKQKIYLPFEETAQTKTLNFSFAENLIFNNLEYELNPKIISDIFDFYLLQIKLFEISRNAYFRHSIMMVTNGIDNKYDVLKILKKYRSKLIEKSIVFFTKSEGFANLVLHEKAREHAFFYKSVYLNLSNSDIEDYLTGNAIKNDGAFLTKWKKIKEQNIKINYLNLKILELQNDTTNEFSRLIEESPFVKIIFKDNSEKLFSYIVSKYPKKKNSAFFSYLYFFMKDNLKLLLILGNDSKDYRKYIIELFGISFARIQNTDSKKSFTKNEMFNLFNLYTDEYYSLKNEDKLSKIE